MIQLREDIAWVRRDDGRLTALDADRLAEELTAAAAVAGQTDWWMADAIATAVQQFVRDELADRVVPARELPNLVAVVLLALGHTAVAAAYTDRQRRAEIRLDDLATQSGGGFELAFYRQLNAVLDAATRERRAFLRMRGLRSCVMRLRGARHWSAGCRQLAEEIVGYVRQRLAHNEPAQLRLLMGD